MCDPNLLEGWIRIQKRDCLKGLIKYKRSGSYLLASYIMHITIKATPVKTQEFKQTLRFHPLTYQKCVSNKNPIWYMWYHISQIDISSFYCFLLPYVQDQIVIFFTIDSSTKVISTSPASVVRIDSSAGLSSLLFIKQISSSVMISEIIYSVLS